MFGYPDKTKAGQGGKSPLLSQPDKGSTMSTRLTEHGITMFSLLSIKGRFQLEMKGIRGRGQTMYSLVKEHYGFKGTRQKVYEQFCQYVEQESAKIKAEDIQNF